VASVKPGLISCVKHVNQSESRARTWLRSPALIGSRIWPKFTCWYIYVRTDSVSAISNYSLKGLLLGPAVRLTSEWLYRPTDVDLRFPASLRPQLALWLVG
jgi:hypothetical protein